MLKRFKFPIRTTEEGKAVPDGGYATAHGDLNEPHSGSGAGSPENQPEVYTLK